MSLLHHPQVGTILRVDLNEGFRIPEMRKRRPAIVVSGPLANRPQLCTIVPLSTTEPRLCQPFNCPLDLDQPLPWPYDGPRMWVKADMLLTVAFHRLKLIYGVVGPDGDRLYDVRVLTAGKMAKIRQCIRFVLGL